jgi:DNA-binding CsgD family transcriptional regulator
MMSERSMEILDTLLLDIYDSAHQCDAYDFSESSLRTLKNALHFDSATMVDYAVSARHEVAIQTIHLHHVPIEKLHDRAAFAGAEILTPQGTLVSRDVVLQAAFANRGRSITADVDHAFHNDPLRDYCRKYENAHSLVLASPTRDATLSLAAFWRADRQRAYDKADVVVASRVLPHLLLAKRINQRLALKIPPHTGHTGRTTHSTRATVLATFDGRLYFVDAAAISLLQREWKQWLPPLLPQTLTDYLRRCGRQQYVGKTIAIASTVQGNLLCIEIMALQSAATLTPAERRVAHLAASGLQYKEIAKSLNVAPATVRNQLHAVYRKLGVTNKTSLAAALAPS